MNRRTILARLAAFVALFMTRSAHATASPVECLSDAFLADFAKLKPIDQVALVDVAWSFTQARLGRPDNNTFATLCDQVYTPVQRAAALIPSKGGAL